MKRRQVLGTLAVATATAFSPSCREQAPIDAGDLSDEQIEGLLRALYGLTLRPGEAAQVRRTLSAAKLKDDIDARVQPAIYFDPEVEVV
jgi:hypothetical protein